TAVKLLAPLFTAENHRSLLEAATHKSKREIEEIVARLRPQPDAQDSIRKLPVSKTARTAATTAATNRNLAAEIATQEATQVPSFDRGWRETAAVGPQHR